MRERELRMRLITRADRPRVLEIVRTIWSGDDYVPEVFDRWVREGEFYGAEVGERLVAVGKLTMLSPTEAWLEGLRVAPRWRRRGIGRALVAFRVARAGERGAAVVRLSTGNDNAPMHRLAPALGFRALIALENWVARPADGERPRRARPLETDALWALVRRTPQRLRLIGSVGLWRWRELARGDIEAAIRRGRCLTRQGALAIVAPEEDRLRVLAHAGPPAALRDLSPALRAEAKARRARLVQIEVPRGAPLERALKMSGYRRTRWPGPTLYEKRF